MFDGTMEKALELGMMRRYEESANQKASAARCAHTQPLPSPLCAPLLPGWCASSAWPLPPPPLPCPLAPSRVRVCAQALVLFAQADLLSAELLFGKASLSAESRKDAQMCAHTRATRAAHAPSLARRAAVAHRRRRCARGDRRR